MAEGKATKETFVQALVALCQEKTYDKITVQDISQLASLNRQTFYYHFEDKFQIRSRYVLVPQKRYQ